MNHCPTCSCKVEGAAPAVHEHRYETSENSGYFTQEFGQRTHHTQFCKCGASITVALKPGARPTRTTGNNSGDTTKEFDATL